MIIEHPCPLPLVTNWNTPALIIIKANYQRRDQEVGICNVDLHRIARKMFWLRRCSASDSLYLLRPQGTLYRLSPRRKKGGWSTYIIDRNVLDIVPRRCYTDYYSLNFDRRIYWNKMSLDITSPVIQISSLALEPKACLALDVGGKLWYCNSGQVSTRQEIVFTKLFSGVVIDTTGMIWYVTHNTLHRCGSPPHKVIDAIYDGDMVYVVLSNGDLYTCRHRDHFQRTNIAGVKKIFLTYDKQGNANHIYITTRRGESFNIRQNNSKTNFIHKPIPYNNMLHVDSTGIGNEIVVFFPISIHNK